MFQGKDLVMTTTSKKDYKEYKRWSQSGLDRIGQEGKDKMLEVYSEEMDRVNKQEDTNKINEVKSYFTQRDLIVKGKETGKIDNNMIKKMGSLPSKRPKNNKGWLRLWNRLNKKKTSKKSS